MYPLLAMLGGYGDGVSDVTSVSSATAMHW